MPVIGVYAKLQFSITFQAKRNNAKMMGTGEGTEAKYNEMYLLILGILGKG